MVIFALVATALSGPMGSHGTQTIGYYSIVSDCQKDLLKIEPTTNKSYVKLDCVPIKVTGEERKENE
jgi:hypothetical protein